MIAYFKSMFFNGTSLKPEAETFFHEVAKAAFKGDVAKKFSALETTDYPACARGWCLRWHPNIDRVSRFTTLLTKAAEQEPDRIADLSVKALHDYLNKNHIEVFNNAGDGT